MEKSVAETEAKAQVAEMENQQLREILREIRVKKVTAEEGIKRMGKECARLQAQVEEQGEWIKAQMERNYTLAQSLEEARNKLGEFRQQLGMARIGYDEFAKLLDRDLGENPTQALAKADVFVSSGKESLAGVDTDGLVHILDVLLGDIGKEETAKGWRGEEPKEMVKPSEINSERLGMLVKIEELTDELKIAGQWKRMYTELVAARTQVAADPRLNCTMPLRRNCSDEDGGPPIELKKRMAVVVAEKERKFQEELGALRAENLDLRRQLEAKSEELAKHVASCQKQAVSVEPAAGRNEAETTAYKLSLIILDKCRASSLDERDVALVRRLFGDDALNLVKESNSQIAELSSDLKLALEALRSQVHA